MAKKKFNINIMGIVAAISIAGFFAYEKYFKKPKPGGEPTPEPLPEQNKPTPGKQTTNQTRRPSASQVKRLQDILISLFSKYNGNSISNVKYTNIEAAGGWGNKSESALKVALSASTGASAYTEPLNSDNAERYINAVTKVNEVRANELKTQQTKQTESSQRKKSASEIVKLVNTGNYKAKLLVDITSPALQFDNVQKTYRTLGDTKKFSKGTVFTSGELVERGDGTILYKSGLKRYPISPDNLLTYTA